MKLKGVAIKCLAVATIILGLMIAGAAVPVKSPQDGALEWAASLSAAERGYHSSPGQVRGLPVEYRKALFGAMATPEERANFWRGVYRAYRVGHTLSARQRTLILRVEDFLTPSVFRGPTLSGSDLEAIAEMSQAVRISLGQAAERELFHTGGPDSGGHGALAPTEKARSMWRTAHSRFLASLRFLAPELQGRFDHLRLHLRRRLQVREGVLLPTARNSVHGDKLGMRVFDVG